MGTRPMEKRTAAATATIAADTRTYAAGWRRYQVIGWGMVTSTRLGHRLLLPVGDAFRVAIEKDPSVSLFGPDGFHPSPLGTYLAAIVIHRALSHRSEPFVPAGLGDPKSGFPEIRTPETVVTLLKVAASVR